jgi:hypothetical protein
VRGDQRRHDARPILRFVRRVEAEVARAVGEEDAAAVVEAGAHWRARGQGQAGELNGAPQGHEMVQHHHGIEAAAPQITGEPQQAEGHAGPQQRRGPVEEVFVDRQEGVDQAALRQHGHGRRLGQSRDVRARRRIAELP